MWTGPGLREIRSLGRRGHAAVVRRAALLARLLPGAPRAWHVAAVAGVLVTGLTMASCLALRPTTAAVPPAASTAPAMTSAPPQPTATVSAPAEPPEPTGSPGVATPAIAVSPQPPDPPPPLPPALPPLPQVGITSISVTTFAYVGETNTTKATIGVTATTSGAFTLSVRYTGLNGDGEEEDGVSPVVQTFPLSGQTSYTVVSTLDASIYCSASQVGVAAIAGGKTSAPVSIDVRWC